MKINRYKASSCTLDVKLYIWKILFGIILGFLCFELDCVDVRVWVFVVAKDTARWYWFGLLFFPMNAPRTSNCDALFPFVKIRTFVLEQFQEVQPVAQVL